MDVVFGRRTPPAPATPGRPDDDHRQQRHGIRHTLNRHAGAARPIVEETYPLEDIGQAHKLTGTGHARGKRVIAVLTNP
ncbi:zinc-binding dehydrogenase [Nonomuraea antimicrobica]|uniref:zinc-binding dehydrogenase n=1 Tax=Nonomuraea antimicrobica TaxID=561173 RepID=UPI0036198CAC